ncbi:MAG TPA: hypothetical protein VKH64_14455 [Candidatus Binatia bacterium]|nr:hypothetical protein [Candidatus Binatia bacterium]
MGYVDHRLQPGERIIYRTKTHPVIFLWPVSLTVISLAGFLAGRENLGEISGGFAALLAVGDILVWQLSDLAVTNRRVIGKFFVRSTHFDEVTLVDLRTLEFEPGILSALFDYGTIFITDVQGNDHYFSGISGEFYQQIQARVERNQRILK